MGALCASVRLVFTRGSGRDFLLDSLLDLPVDSLLERCSLDHRPMFQTSPVRCRFTALSLISKLEFLIARAAVSQTFRKRFGKRRKRRLLRRFPEHNSYNYFMLFRAVLYHPHLFISFHITSCCFTYRSSFSHTDLGSFSFIYRSFLILFYRSFFTY